MVGWAFINCEFLLYHFFVFDAEVDDDDEDALFEITPSMFSNPKNRKDICSNKC